MYASIWRIGSFVSNSGYKRFDPAVRANKQQPIRADPNQVLEIIR